MFADLEKAQNGSHLSYIIKRAQQLLWRGRGLAESQILSGEDLNMLGSITPYITQTSSAPNIWSLTKHCSDSYTDMSEVTRRRSLFPLVVCSVGKLLLFLILVCLIFTSSHQLISAKQGDPCFEGAPLPQDDSLGLVFRERECRILQKQHMVTTHVIRVMCDKTDNTKGYG